MVLFPGMCFAPSGLRLLWITLVDKIIYKQPKYPALKGNADAALQAYSLEIEHPYAFRRGQKEKKLADKPGSVLSLLPSPRQSFL